MSPGESPVSAAPEGGKSAGGPRPAPAWAADLEKILEGSTVQTDPDVLEAYSRDRAPLAPAGTPVAMVRARNVEDVARTLKFANERRIPVVTRAAGSGLAGGANAIDGCIILSVSAMDKILNIEREVKRTQLGLSIRIKNKLTSEQQMKLQELHHSPHPPR